MIRGGYGRFLDKPHFEIISAIVTAGVFSNSFIASFPANAADSGPSRGEQPSDPFLRNGPTVDRALLAELFPRGSRVRNSGNVFLDNPDRRIPYTDQLSIGAERGLDLHLSVSIDYVHAFGRDQFMIRDLNPGVRVDTTRTGRIVRQDPAFVSSVFTRVNTGRTDYDVRLGCRFRFGQRRLEVFGEVFNLTNKANFELAAADRRSTDFLTYTALRASAVPRTGQLGLRFTF